MRTRSSLFLFAIALSVGCGSKTLYHSYNAVAPAVLPDSAFVCVAKELETLGFKRTAYNTEDRTISGQRTAKTPRESNALAREWYDQLDVKLLPGNAGGTDMTVKASSFMVVATQRGPTAEEHDTYKEAEVAADSLITACGGTRG